ncbi:MAG: PIG-L family deacetylase [Oceanipulchritudo sp.]
MNFTQPNASLYIPDSMRIPPALARTTHLGVGAHQDDLEFMALHGILACFRRDDQWFAGITCTDGAGSSRSGPYSTFTDEEMKAIRVEEQKVAAGIGDYAFMAQLGHPSRHAKDASLRETLVEDLGQLLAEARPRVVYTHNPFDKHATHVGVLLALLEAIRKLPASSQPETLLGCEVWRGLDWLPDNRKVIHDVSSHPNLAASLNGVFDSQIAGGKRYDLAVEGRRLANATFHESHAVDAADRVSYAIDLTPLLSEEGPSLKAFMEEILEAFREDLHWPL